MTADVCERQARVTLSFLADPADAVLGAALRLRTAADILASLTGEAAHGQLTSEQQTHALDASMRRWRGRLGLVPPAARLAAWQESGLRLICPGDPDWPSQLDDLGDAQPLLLWARGSASLLASCARSVSVVGARAATAYGQSTSVQMSASLAERGFTVVSGGAFGIDASAHRGALAADGRTVAVLAGGLSYGYPRAHEAMFAAIAAGGALVSESPPSRAPTRSDFLSRNRITAALSRATIVIEASRRSGSLNTARHARELRRPVMAVPGPVTSEQSAGCHELIRKHAATCVTSARDVLDDLESVCTGT